MRLMTLLSTSALLLTAACGEPTRPVTGSLDLAAHGRSTATLVAVRDDGAVREVEVRRDGRFEVELEVGHEHALAFTSDDDGRAVTFANVVVKSEHRRSSRLRATDDDGALDLGELELEHGAEAVETCDGAAGTNDSTIVVATAADHDVGDDHGVDALEDTDDDGRPDRLDDDVDGDGRCDDHGANSGADSASDQNDDHGADSGADSASDAADDHGANSGADSASDRNDAADDHGANSGADSASDQNDAADDHGANSGADSASDAANGG